jgi:hypothetical protein
MAAHCANLPAPATAARYSPGTVTATVRSRGRTSPVREFTVELLDAPSDRGYVAKASRREHLQE